MNERDPTHQRTALLTNFRNCGMQSASCISHLWIHTFKFWGWVWWWIWRENMSVKTIRHNWAIFIPNRPKGILSLIPPCRQKRDRTTLSPQHLWSRKTALSLLSVLSRLGDPGRLSPFGMHWEKPRILSSEKVPWFGTLGEARLQAQVHFGGDLLCPASHDRQNERYSHSGFGVRLYPLSPVHLSDRMRQGNSGAQLPGCSSTPLPLTWVCPNPSSPAESQQASSRLWLAGPALIPPLGG